MNENNRSAIVIAAGLGMILMAVVVFLTWSAHTDGIDRLGDAVEFMANNNDTAGRLAITMGALALGVLALLVIVIELAPEDVELELKVEQAGTTMIVPAAALRARLEEALVRLPDVSAAKARVSTRDKGIATRLDVSVTPGANVANVTERASRVVVDTMQTELGLPLSGLPTVRIGFGGPKEIAVTPAAVVVGAPVETPELPAMEPGTMMGDAGDAPPPEPAVMDPLEGVVPEAEAPATDAQRDDQTDPPGW